MALQTRFSTFKEFYPFYLTQHADTTCRALHFVGTTLVMISFFAGLISGNWMFFALMPIAGYGFAWFGHFGFEKNKPAAFGNPFYSLASDFLMYWHILSGQLPQKLEAAKKQFS
jgi:hypothetical protein